jgi:hypothetical protein
MSFKMALLGLQPVRSNFRQQLVVKTLSDIQISDQWFWNLNIRYNSAGEQYTEWCKMLQNFSKNSMRDLFHYYPNQDLASFTGQGQMPSTGQKLSDCIQ